MKRFGCSLKFQSNFNKFQQLEIAVRAALAAERGPVQAADSREVAGTDFGNLDAKQFKVV